MAGVMDLLQGLLGVGSAQAAEPPNPMGKVLPFPGTRQPGVLGEGGGGGVAPQPPNRFKDIMGDIDAEVARRSKAREGQGQPTKEVDASTLPPHVQGWLENYKPGTLRTKPGNKGEPADAAEAQRWVGMGLLTQEQANMIAQAERMGLPAPRTAPGAANPGNFMERRNAQLRDESDARYQAAMQRITSRANSARSWIEGRKRPRLVDTAEQGHSQRINLREPEVNERGYVREYFGDGNFGGNITTNPHNGFTTATVQPPVSVRGVLGMENLASIPFRTRAEALEYLATRPSLAQARAKADLQRQRLRTQGPDPFDQ